MHITNHWLYQTYIALHIIWTTHSLTMQHTSFFTPYSCPTHSWQKAKSEALYLSRGSLFFRVRIRFYLLMDQKKLGERRRRRRYPVPEHHDVDQHPLEEGEEGQQPSQQGQVLLDGLGGKETIKMIKHFFRLKAVFFKDWDFSNRPWICLQLKF